MGPIPRDWHRILSAVKNWAWNRMAICNLDPFLDLLLEVFNGQAEKSIKYFGYYQLLEAVSVGELTEHSSNFCGTRKPVACAQAESHPICRRDAKLSNVETLGELVKITPMNKMALVVGFD